MLPTDDLTLTHHDSADAANLMDALCDVYADAYDVEPDGEKTAAFRTRATKALDRPRYGLLTARDGTRIVGFVFGYALSAGTSWWDGLTPAQTEGFTGEDGTRTFALAEIEVRRAWQGESIGRLLNDTVLAQRQEQRATLATGPQADAARAIYEGWGWQPVGKIPGKSGSYFSEYALYVLPLRRDDGG
ncbi:MAG: GNAT family N-acetyltransferase [Pseudonocardiaceae bacterium]